MQVVVVESPGKVKSINKYLGPGYKVMASYGHIRDLPSKDGSVKPDEDFAMTWDIDGKSIKHVKEIADAMREADGLILATPTGSTAYALSSGGPILHPSVAGLILVPVSPHTLSNRPIVVGDGSRIEVVLLRAARGSIYFDGRDHHTLLAGDRLTVTTSPHRSRLLHPAAYSYYRTLREKLGWSGSPQPGA